MGEAIQTLRQPIISIPVHGVTIAQLSAATYLVPVPCYPFSLEFVKVKMTNGGNLDSTGSFDIELLAGSTPETFYLAKAITGAQVYFDNLLKPIQVGHFYMSVGVVTNFGVTAPVVPTPPLIGLTIGPVLAVPTAPYISVTITNRAAAAPDQFDIDIGVAILDRGLDFKPVFYPGAGSSGTLSSSNI